MPLLPLGTLITLLIFVTVLTYPVDSNVECSTTQLCEKEVRPGSQCIQGFCTNPFGAGCLRRHLGEEYFPRKRTCNSEDPHNAEVDGICEMSSFNYNEVRILNQNWDSPVVTAWVMQILLSEIMEVPVTIETSDKDRGFNFYDPQNQFDYASKTYDYEALREAMNVKDCRLTDKSCAHVMPEVWNGQFRVLDKLEEEGFLETIDRGIIVKYSWYIPKFLAREDPMLLTYYGLSGEKNRHKLAKLFKRPTTWKEYCDSVSYNNCTYDNGIALRAPQTREEGERYFVDGVYKGHFRPTDKNNCDTFPDLCTGHISNVVCSWSTYAIPQAHYLNISVESDGPDPANGGYPFSRMVEIYHAANATKSGVLFYWFTPDPMLQSYLGTDAEMQEVYLPPPTQKCIMSRVSAEDRCSLDPIKRIGSRDGSCDSEAHPVLRVVTPKWYNDTSDAVDALQSPAYDFVKKMRITSLQLQDIFELYYRRNNTRWNYYTREATCRWVADNIDLLRRYIPATYPRILEEAQSYNQPFLYVAMTLGIIATLLIIVTAMLVHKWRKKKVIIYAQSNFLFLTLFGMFLVAIGSTIYTIEPRLRSCIARVWLINLGYSLELIPLIVKVAALNKIFRSARKMKRVVVNQKDLYKSVGGVVILVFIYLVLWTSIDPPKRQVNYVLTENINDGDKYIVERGYSCRSNSGAWMMVSLGWQLLLLVCASVLAFQSRTIRQEFNESKFLGMLIYSHFVFVILRGTVFMMMINDTIEEVIYAGMVSFLLATDAFATVGIYFLPKLLKARVKDDDASQRRSNHLIPRSIYSDMNQDPKTNILEVTPGRTEQFETFSPSSWLAIIKNIIEEVEEIRRCFASEPSDNGSIKRIKVFDEMKLNELDIMVSRLKGKTDDLINGVGEN